jgi:hypothetical protein
MKWKSYKIVGFPFFSCLIFRLKSKASSLACFWLILKAGHGCQAMVWSRSDFGSPSVTWMFKRAGVASETGWMPVENEAERLYHCLTAVEYFCKLHNRNQAKQARLQSLYQCDEITTQVYVRHGSKTLKSVDSSVYKKL